MNGYTGKHRKCLTELSGCKCGACHDALHRYNEAAPKPTRAEAYRAARMSSGSMWDEVPVPRRWHRCKPFTSGSTRGLSLVERCACGAIRLDGDGHPWMKRNSRRSL